MDVNSYLARQYDNPPCWALVTDVLRRERGLPVTNFKPESTSLRAIARAFRIALHTAPEGFAPLRAPVDFAIVLLGKNARLGLHHCGVFYRGAVLHALPSITLWQDMASLLDEFELVEYWERA